MGSSSKPNYQIYKYILHLDMPNIYSIQWIRNKINLTKVWIVELGITRFCDDLDGLIRDTVFISVFVKPFYTVTVFRQYRF